MSAKECEATFDVAPDGVLFCIKQAGHAGMHVDRVWWLPVPTRVAPPEPTDSEAGPTG